jgi:hypothetical protein
MTCNGDAVTSGWLLSMAAGSVGCALALFGEIVLIIRALRRRRRSLFWGIPLALPMFWGFACLWLAGDSLRASATLGTGASSDIGFCMFYLDFRGELALAVAGTAILVVLGVLALAVISRVPRNTLPPSTAATVS